jgi:uncharacterized membrane protein YcgQ (UPF0703/DUF1980 family)
VRKKYGFALIFLLLCTLAFTSQTNKYDGVLEIKDRLFMAQVNDIYRNSKNYMGKTIKYQGVFGRYIEAPDKVKNYYVIRYGPGCCGDDSYIGFEVVLEGADADKDYPKNDDWVLAEGKLEEYDYEGVNLLRIRLSSLSVLSQRGLEFVKN